MTVYATDPYAAIVQDLAYSYDGSSPPGASPPPSRPPATARQSQRFSSWVRMPL
ncbi:hypothetical protein [Pedococcus sp. 5OH_020]|uniref:hypothetical protein n=1 Tax=Pedococcus sp. 5OH_020 TaxID=2989814 RepID=UPI0022EA0659|nr:hypothetical protein [Pedococcus sp. 5OH_020]